ncbi:hypothetical protein BDV93DRAFT_502931 [Ceratobasidium sp. AG-I]|nr:hypothetical protein BDV93DRAFT_502931 [Ceratobasidium sp. AG-I]
MSLSLRSVPRKIYLGQFVHNATLRKGARELSCEPCVTVPPSPTRGSGTGSKRMIIEPTWNSIVNKSRGRTHGALGRVANEAHTYVTPIPARCKFVQSSPDAALEYATRGGARRLAHVLIRRGISHVKYWSLNGSFCAENGRVTDGESVWTFW